MDWVIEPAWSFSAKVWQSDGVQWVYKGGGTVANNGAWSAELKKAHPELPIRVTFEAGNRFVTIQDRKAPCIPGL